MKTNRIILGLLLLGLVAVCFFPTPLKAQNFDLSMDRVGIGDRGRNGISLVPEAEENPAESLECDLISEYWWDGLQETVRVVGWEKWGSNCDLELESAGRRYRAFVGQGEHEAIPIFPAVFRRAVARNMMCAHLRRSMVHRVDPYIHADKLACDREGRREIIYRISYAIHQREEDPNERFIGRLPEGAFQETVRVVEFATTLPTAGPSMCSGVIEFEVQDQTVLARFFQLPRVSDNEREATRDPRSRRQYARELTKSASLCEWLLVAYIQGWHIDVTGEITRGENPYIGIREMELTWVIYTS